jgi:enterochelin esterase-like enzyme
VHAVDTRFRAIRARTARGIGGLSEGGYGAINIAVHHPREFGLVESWSGYEKADDLGSIFGHRPSLLARNTPLDTLAAAAPKLRQAHTFFWLYSGRDDRFLGQNLAFASLLQSGRIAHRLRIVSGGHNWALWRGNAADAYLAASKHLRARGVA